MFEYVRQCKSMEESAMGSCKEVLSKTRKYSETRLSRIFDLFDVKSKLFKTIHFLTVSPSIYCRQILNTLPQFLSTLSDEVSLRWFR